MRSSKWMFTEDECPNADHPEDVFVPGSGTFCGLCGKSFK